MNYLLRMTFVGAFIAVQTFAGVEIFPDKPGDLGSIVIPNPSQSGPVDDIITITTHVDCYPTNLRGARNPLSPAGTLQLDLSLNTPDDAPTPKIITLEFPARTFFPQVPPAVTPAEFIFQSPPPADRVGWTIDYDATSRLLITKLPITVGTLTVTPSGNFEFDTRPISLNSFRLLQTGIGPGGKYFGSPGRVDGYVNATVSPDGKRVEINANFVGAADPGQRAGARRRSFCGSYYSPLMLFFSKAKPKFWGSSPFPLGVQGGWVKWPEPQAPGYFLAMDRDGSGKIDQKNELFGENLKDNGFDALKLLDSNGDKKITASDKLFSKLQLWNDKNGDGFSDEGEVSSITDKKVISIDLNYDDSSMVALNNGVELREKSTFTFIESGKRQKGEIIDIWFSQAPIPGWNAKQIIGTSEAQMSQAQSKP